MKKLLPFAFPLAALIIVAFLAFRWYSMRDSRGQVGPVNEGVEIENLTQEQRESMLKGTTDFKTVVLEPTDQASIASGDVRYEIADGRVAFSVAADLPTTESGVYQVWIKSGDDMSPAFTLSSGKGGYLGSAAFSETLLPVEVAVTKEMTADQTMEEVILRGNITK